jgi:hypothetical protein
MAGVVVRLGSTNRASPRHRATAGLRRLSGTSREHLREHRANVCIKVVNSFAMQGVRGPDCILVCHGCGTEFRLKRWQLTGRHTGQYCSRSCSDSVRGERSRHWRGGNFINHNGYRRVRVDGRYEFEHRVVAAEMLDRPLRRDERVHHINGDKLDNRPINLEVVSQSDHMRSHQRDPNWTRPVRDAARRSSPAKSEAMRRRWSDPSQRAEMTRAIRRGKGLMEGPAQTSS